MLTHVIAFFLNVLGVGPFLLWLLSKHARPGESNGEVTALVVDFSWTIWIPFGMGLLLAIYWVWALRGVVRSWSDPVARILRFCSLALLLGQFVGIVFLLGSPLTARLLKEEAPVEDADSR